MAGSSGGRTGGGGGDEEARTAAAQGEPPTEQLLRSIVETAAEIIMVVAADGTIRYINRTPGTTPAQVVGTNVYDWLDPESARVARACIASVFATGQPSGYDAVVTGTDIERRLYYTRVGPLITDGAVTAVTLVSTDVDDLKRVEEALRQSERRLRLAVDATDMGIWSWDAQRDVVTWDDTMCRHYRVSRRDAPTTYEGFRQLIYPGDRDAVVASIGRALETGVYADIEHRVVPADGQVRWLHIKGTAIRDDEGAVVGLLGGVFDITERRRVEEQLLQGQKLQAVGQLASGVAHNFNNMLAGVLINLALAARRGPPELKEIIADATTSASRAAEVVRQLVELTGKTATAERQPSDLATIARSVTNMCRKSFPPSIELRLSCPAELPPVEMNASQIEQALLNLAINARDAVKAPGVESPHASIEVDVLPATAPELSVIDRPCAGRYARIRVRDNGPGIDDDARARIFEPFFTTKSGTGAGLGLASALSIAVEHGGWLACDSTPGRGSTFSMYLPCARERPAAADSAPAAEHQGSGHGTVLLVDDEDLVRRSVAALLEDGGYTVLQAADGGAALQRYADEGDAIDVVLLDQSMPGLSGAQVLERLVELDPDVRVVLFTGLAPNPRAFPRAAGFLQKPIAAERLFATLRDCARPHD